MDDVEVVDGLDEGLEEGMVDEKDNFVVVVGVEVEVEVEVGMDKVVFEVVEEDKRDEENEKDREKMNMDMHEQRKRCSDVYERRNLGRENRLDEDQDETLEYVYCARVKEKHEYLYCSYFMLDNQS